MATNDKPLIAFFGATGGCCAAALARTLKAGYPCSALARTSSKLTSLLLSKDVSDSTLSTNLIIISGDIRDTAAVSRVLCPHNNTVASIIISGIGAQPTLDNLIYPLTLCTDATKSIFTALRDLNPATKKPLYISLSTTGITSGPQDLPLLMWLPYHLLGHRPHTDKRNAEKVVVGESKKKQGEGAVFRDHVIVRPSLLTDGPALGKGQVREGTEREPAVGYTISRNDVGGWIFETLVDSEEGRGRWVGEAVTITY